MGDVSRIRSVVYSDRRWESSFKTADVREFERAHLARFIAELRKARVLPTRESHEVPMLPIAEWINWICPVPSTVLQLVYNWTDDKLILVALKRRQL